VQRALRDDKVSEDEMKSSSRAKRRRMQRESGARVPQTSIRHYRGVLRISHSTVLRITNFISRRRTMRSTQQTGRNNSDRWDRVTASFPSKAPSAVRERRSGQRARPALSLPPPRNETANRFALRKDQRSLAPQNLEQIARSAAAPRQPVE
jgi:hypothetical protein